MFFTFVAKVIAWILTIVGALNATLKIAIVSGWITGGGGAMAIWTQSKTPGESIDYSIKIFLIGVVIGVLADISKSVRALQKDP